MLPDKLTILEQINTAIQKNSCKGDSDAGEDKLANNASDQLTAYLNHYLTSLPERTTTKMNNLEQRIETLESENDRLLYFIHFLFKNFPELVKDIVTTSCFRNRTEAASQQPVVENKSWNNEAPCITRREVEILQLVIKGLGAKEIASQLYISESTVITHKKNLKEKFNAKNTAELISKAFNLSPYEAPGS